MTAINTADLTGRALDWAVAKAEGLLDRPDTFPRIAPVTLQANGRLTQWHRDEDYSPSEDWGLGGEIIEREGINLVQNYDTKVWLAGVHGRYGIFHHPSPTGLIAAMRCHVARKLGPVVHVPCEVAP
jgi:Protein of unknown function (DUF2591)